MLNLFLTSFVLALLALGLRRPYLWVLAYLYIDVVAPQKISWGFLQQVPISLIAFVAAFAGWLVLDDKRHSRFTLRQALVLALLLYCGLTTLTADFPEAAADKWAWVWKALVFAVFLPLTLTSRLRLEGAVLIMVLSAGSIIITGAIKTILSGGGYGSLHFYVNDNVGLYESSIISCVAVAIIPLIAWLARFGTVFRPDLKVRAFALGLGFACLLIPVGTQARTGLLCIGLLAVLSLRTVKRRFLYLGLMGLAALAAIPLLPASYTERMSTIENHQSDESASTRLAVWAWTLDYVRDNPLGGGFDAYRGNRLRVETRAVSGEDNNAAVETGVVEDQARAYHSSYFEMLGEQGWPGFILWMWLQAAGLWQMERLRRRWKLRAADLDRNGPGAGPAERWQAPLAEALQHAQLIYLLGSLFVGIAYQPFIMMLVGVQCGLWSYLRRIEARAPRPAPPHAPPVLRVRPEGPALRA